MKRQDKHINKFLRDPLPDPEIPADDAWAGMSDMLDAAENHGANGRGRFSQTWKSIGKLRGLLIVTSALVLTSAVIALIILNTETKNQKSANVQSVKSNIQDSALAKTAVKTPSLHPDTNLFSAATTPSESTSPKAAGAPSPVASKNRIISNERTELKSKNSPTAANSRRTHTAGARTGGPRTGDTRMADVHTGSKRAGSSSTHGKPTGTRTSDLLAGGIQADVTRAGNAPAPASTHANRRDAFPNPINRQNEETSPKNQLNPGQAGQETIPSFSPEKNTNAIAAQTSLNSLEPLAGHFEITNNDLSKLVKKPNAANQPQPPVKRRSSIWQGVHFGPEWNINRSIVSTDYMFTNADSIKRPARLVIPGLFISKSWNRHAATFIFNPLHSYFGDKERVAQRLDTIRISDSTYYVNRYNTNFVKSFGMNFSLQYQYRVFSLFSLVGGVSYAKYSSALLFREVEYSAGFVVNEKHLAAKGQETLKSYIRPQQWNIRAGILFHSPDVFNNRLQFAWMTTFPVSKLSLNGFRSVKTPNMQLSLRFLIK